AEAARTPRFLLKFVDAFAFALPSLLLTLRLARPDARPDAIALWLIAPFVLLGAGVIVELTVVPQDEWLTRLIGDNSMHCMGMIPTLAAPILAALIIAPSCADDSPLFVATWYPLATLICIGVGTLAGRRFLSW